MAAPRYHYLTHLHCQREGVQSGHRFEGRLCLLQIKALSKVDVHVILMLKVLQNDDGFLGTCRSGRRIVRAIRREVFGEVTFRYREGDRLRVARQVLLLEGIQLGSNLQKKGTVESPSECRTSNHVPACRT